MKALTLLMVLMTIQIDFGSTECPPDLMLSSGVCIRKNSNICSQTTKCYQPKKCISTDPKICPFSELCSDNYVLYGDLCVPTYVAQCPVSEILKFGHCYAELEPTPVLPIAESICPGNSFPFNGSCAICPEHTEFLNGQCVKCKPNMDLRDGRCVCLENYVLINDECIKSIIQNCTDHELFEDGVCVPQYCYGRRCCRDTACNACFRDCKFRNKHKNTATLSKCQANCMDGIRPTFTPLTDAPDKNYPEPPPSPPKRPPRVTPQQRVPRKNKPVVVNIFNYVNETNAKNITTRGNNTNINEITISSNILSGNSKLSGRWFPRVSSQAMTEEECCVIAEPKDCQKVGDKYKCKQKRRHVCGNQCKKEPKNTVNAQKRDIKTKRKSLQKRKTKN